MQDVVKITDSRLSYDDQGVLSLPEDIIEDARNGRMFILVDDEDRENEGDLVIPAQMATPDAINFMAKYGRGLICLAMDKARIDALGLPLVASRSASRLGTAFTVSIEAKDGITTGISAADRARTIQVAIDPASGPQDIVTPGHVFPLAARDGGVLVRTGHTEAGVDIARAAGLNPSAVICEIMNDDGTMARMPDLVAFAQKHALKIGTIASLIAHRRRTEKLVERVAEVPFHSAHGGAFQMAVYRDCLSGVEHIALVKGEISGEDPVTVRMHALSILDDVLGDTSLNRQHDLHAAMQEIDQRGRGVVVLLRSTPLQAVTDRLKGTPKGENAADRDRTLRRYGVGAQILSDLGLRKMILLSNSQRTIVGLDGYGLEVVATEPIPAVR